MPDPYDSGGVAETLDELERKLRELERQLTQEGSAAAGSRRPEPAPRSAARPDPARVEPPVGGDPPVGVTSEPGPPASTERLGSLAGQLDELERFREQLERTARELEEEYGQLVHRLEPAAPATERGGVGESGGPVPEPPAVAKPARRAPERPRSAPTDPTATFAGTVTLGAGPFSDIAALGAFEQALSHARGVEDVYVSGFEDHRAIVELELAGHVPLLAELRAVLPGAFRVREAGAERIAIDLEPPAPAA